MCSYKNWSEANPKATARQDLADYVQYVAKVRYRALNKNAHRLLVTCALANMFIARRHLLCCQETQSCRYAPAHRTDNPIQLKTTFGHQPIAD